MPFARLPRVVLLLSAMLWLAGCAASDMSPSGTGPAGNPCANGNAAATRQAPIVCVDDSNRTLRVTPDPIETHDVLQADRRSPVMLHWYTNSGRGDLQLEIAPGCVTRQKCDGRGHCWAQSVPGKSGQCKYDVWINGGNHDRLDPTIILTPCCT